MSSEPLITILIKFWKNEEGPDEIEAREQDTHKKYSNLDKDMYLIGEFYIDKEFKGTIGKRTEFWNISKNTPNYIDSISYNIFKIFDSDNKWIGTIEERLIDEIIQSYKSDPRLIFSIELKGSKYIFNLTQRPDFYIFPFLLHERSTDVEFFLLEKKLLAIGSDWELKRCILGDFKVAYIDSKRGKKIKISIFNEDLTKTALFLNYLTLFACTIPFHDEIKSRLKEYSKAIKDSTLILKVSNSVLNQYLGKRSTVKRKSADSKPKIKKTVTKEGKTPSRKKGKPKKDLKESLTKEITKSKLETERKLPELDDQSTPDTSTSEIKQTHVDDDFSFKIEDPIEKAPGIGKKTGARFRELGINTIGDFINTDIDDLHKRLPISWITKSKLKKWQDICIEHII
ncbi:MAG: hypothetical protein ACTSPY_11470 [Candidatus Helarchaeota archaeon]